MGRMWRNIARSGTIIKKVVSKLASGPISANLET